MTLYFVPALFLRTKVIMKTYVLLVWLTLADPKAAPSACSWMHRALLHS